MVEDHDPMTLAFPRTTPPTITDQALGAGSLVTLPLKPNPAELLNTDSEPARDYKKDRQLRVLLLLVTGALIYDTATGNWWTIWVLRMGVFLFTLSCAGVLLLSLAFPRWEGS